MYMYWSRVKHSLNCIEHLDKHRLIKITIAIEAAQILLEILHSHRHIQTFGIVIVLVHVQHNYGVGQAECGIRIGKRLVIASLSIKIYRTSLGWFRN